MSDESIFHKPLRVWPGVVIVIVQWATWLALPIVMPGAMMYAVMGGFVGGLAVVLWWLFFSRAPWSERVGALILMAIAPFATFFILHPSIATGMMGMMFPMYVVPALSLGFVIGAVAGSRLSRGPRRATMVAAILIASGLFGLLRTEGVTGDLSSILKWRWTETPEERLLARGADEPAAIAPSPAAVEAPKEPIEVQPPEERAALPEIPARAKPKTEWPGFRGTHRDGIVRGVRIETDWSVSPPKELWRRPVGPGWSSFAVRGNLIYTQEQRGDDEVVACYSVTSGQPVWRHTDPVRFWESNGGAGPRGTPTLSNGRVYTLGATGILNALNARDGRVVWSRDISADAERKVPTWGFASSPLVIGDALIVAASGRLVGYDPASGKPRWVGPASPTSYSSPHLMTIRGVDQILLLSGAGATSVAPADGRLLWEHAWPGAGMLQPAITADGDVLMAATGDAGGFGIRRIAVTPGSDGWNVEERWTSNGLKPYFNDFVVHNGHAYGFDGRILSCIDLQDGTRRWKGGRFGHGQLVLLADQDLLLVLSEEGELALVRAAPEQFTEVARFQAIEGKTWNHPVVVDDVVLVRNGAEMAAFRLARAVP